MSPTYVDHLRHQADAHDRFLQALAESHLTRRLQRRTEEERLAGLSWIERKIALETKARAKAELATMGVTHDEH